MKKEHQEFVKILQTTFEMFPEWRIGQALFNLSINEFMEDKLVLRDIYNDTDKEILDRIGKKFL